MKKFMFLVCGCLMAMNSVAQQQLGQRARVQSPVVNADGTVTFNFYSPSAQRVSVSGDFDEIRNQRLEMTKQETEVKKNHLQQFKKHKLCLQIFLMKKIQFTC